MSARLKGRGLVLTRFRGCHCYQCADAIKAHHPVTKNPSEAQRALHSLADPRRGHDSGLRVSYLIKGGKVLSTKVWAVGYPGRRAAR